MTPLEEVLAGRDERAAWQRLWLEATEGSYFICQIGLNIPGYPKRIPRDIEIVRKCRKYLMDHAHAVPSEERYLENGAGVCWQGAFDALKFEAAALKKCAVEAENSMTAGRVLDIDIIPRGLPFAHADGISRTPLPALRREGEGLREAWYPLSTGAEGEGDQDNKRRLAGDVISRGFGLESYAQRSLF